MECGSSARTLFTNGYRTSSLTTTPMKHGTALVRLSEDRLSAKSVRVLPQAIKSPYPYPMETREPSHEAVMEVHAHDALQRLDERAQPRQEVGVLLAIGGEGVRKVDQAHAQPRVRRVRYVALVDQQHAAAVEKELALLLQCTGKRSIRFNAGCTTFCIPVSYIPASRQNPPLSIVCDVAALQTATQEKRAWHKPLSHMRASITPPAP